MLNQFDVGSEQELLHHLKMKLFQATQKFYEVCGIVNQPKDRQNLRIVVFLLFKCSFFVSLIATFFFKSTSFEEYIDTFCLLVTIVTAFVNILECVWKRTKMFKFIEQWEKLIEKSNF